MANECFQTVYEEYSPRIRCYLRRLAGDAEADDLTQEVFLKIANALKGFRGDAGLATWIFTIATNCVRDRLRQSSCKTYGRLRETIPSAGGLAGVADASILPQDARLIQEEMGACLRRELNQLAGTHRAVLILSDMEGFTDAEIASILNIPLSIVKIRLHRARTKLRGLLRSRCSFSRTDQNVLVCDQKIEKQTACADSANIQKSRQAEKA